MPDKPYRLTWVSDSGRTQYRYYRCEAVMAGNIGGLVRNGVRHIKVDVLDKDDESAQDKPQ